VAGAIIVAIAAMAVGADLLAPHSPVEVRMDVALQPRGS
jgi:hypothetical protein